MSVERLRLPQRALQFRLALVLRPQPVDDRCARPPRHRAADAEPPVRLIADDHAQELSRLALRRTIVVLAWRQHEEIRRRDVVESLGQEDVDVVADARCQVEQIRPLLARLERRELVRRDDGDERGAGRGEAEGVFALAVQVDAMVRVLERRDAHAFGAEQPDHLGQERRLAGA